MEGRRDLIEPKDHRPDARLHLGPGPVQRLRGHLPVRHRRPVGGDRLRSVHGRPGDR